MSTLKWSLLALVAAFAVGCGDKDPPAEDTGSPADDTEDTGPELASIPDPGTEAAPDRWYDDGGYHGTPETAQVMGVVTRNPSYIQGGIDPDTEHHYFVFRTGPEQDFFSVNLFDKSSNIASVHIHDGTGLVFGDEVEPDQVIKPTQASWVLQPDTVYVFVVYSPMGGFF